MPSGIDTILNNTSNLEVMEMLVSYSSDAYLYSLNSKEFDVSGRLESFRNTMDEEGCHSFKEFVEYAKNKDDDGFLLNQIEDYINYYILGKNQLTNTNCLEYCKSELADGLEIIKGEKEYIKIIIDMIKKGLPDLNSKDDLLLAQRYAVTVIEELLEENDDLDINSSPDKILARISTLGLRKKLSDKLNSENDFADWDKSLSSFRNSYENFSKLDNQNKNLLRSKITNSENLRQSQSGIDRISNDAKKLEIVNMLASYLSEGDLKIALNSITRDTPEFSDKNNDLYFRIDSIRELMDEYKCFTIEDLIEYSKRSNVDKLIGEELDLYLSDIMNLCEQQSYSDTFERVLDPMLEDHRGLEEYIKIIASMSKQGLPGVNSQDQILNAHKDSIEQLNDFLNLNPDLTIDSDPKIIMTRLLDSAKNRPVGNLNFSSGLVGPPNVIWNDFLDYKQLPQTQKRYIKQKCNLPLSNDMSQVNSQSSNLEQGIGVSLNNDNTSDIKAKFKASLQKLQIKSEINSFTEPAIKNIKNKDYYETTVKKGNAETVIRMAKDGQKAHIKGGFNAESYKLLIKSFVDTNDIMDLNDIKPEKVPPSKLEEARRIIHESVSAHRVEKGEPALPPFDEPQQNNSIGITMR
ncbi:MAG: hypothetical protein HRT87_00925 [Legionellales bacterium]|nr:hypothetical protein [Legionellales bacterium]